MQPTVQLNLPVQLSLFFANAFQIGEHRMDGRRQHPPQGSEDLGRPLRLPQFRAGCLRVREEGPHRVYVQRAEVLLFFLLDLYQRDYRHHRVHGGIPGGISTINRPKNGGDQILRFVAKLLAHVRNLLVDGFERHAPGHQSGQVVLQYGANDTAYYHNEQQCH